MHLQEPSTAEIIQRVAWMEFQARKAQGANPESAGTIRDGIDAILAEHPGVIWHATILVSRHGMTTEERLQRSYDAAGCEVFDAGLIVCAACLDDGLVHADDDDEPICACLHTAADVAA